MDNYEQQNISITEVIALLAAGWRVIVLITVVMTVLMLILAFIMQPVYKATVLLAPVEDSASAASLASMAGQLGGLASLAGIDLGGGDSQKDEALAILRSRKFSVDFINDNQLMPVLFEDEWDAENSAWTESDVDEQPSEWDAFKLFNEDIRSVSEDRGNGQLTLEILWHDPLVAQQWANQLVRRANNVIRKDAIDEANRSIEYLERELENTSVVEVRNSIFQLIEQQISAVMLANVRDDYAFKVLDPAVASDADDFVEPRRALMVIAGLFLGLFFGVVVVIARQSLGAFGRQAA